MSEWSTDSSQLKNKTRCSMTYHNQHVLRFSRDLLVTSKLIKRNFGSVQTSRSKQIVFHFSDVIIYDLEHSRSL
ncbi:hypothetical protein NQ317_010409 [Molorchus minor]|uniref:Uncharacterized protein n=1 Tax=Molorchus minor TaxID=1323400 RepID=A0ABQ9JHY3_9CUCU|nr:hypothetical protein NQ317_010409 [Molorchus minor]